MELEITGNLNNDFCLALWHLMDSGLEAFPRGTTTREHLNYNITLFDPRNRIIHFKDRKTNLAYLLGEFIWYMSGSNDPSGILPFSKFWDSIRNDDGTINSNYGHRFFGHHADCNVDRGYDDKLSQWAAVKDILQKDKDSRQAVMNVHLPQDRTSVNKDVPCTLSLQFFIRMNSLHLIVNMRSNDIVLGFTNDVFQFTMLQEAMLVELKKHYPELQLGQYFHNAGSMHIYERHFEMANKIIADPDVLEMPMAPMDSFTDDILTGLIGTQAAWLDAGKPSEFDFDGLGAFNMLTPYWKNLVKFCFVHDHHAMYAVYGVPHEH